eukprot:2643399-Heterocapsa_arctica.AAC.1
MRTIKKNIVKECLELIKNPVFYLCFCHPGNCRGVGHLKCERANPGLELLCAGLANPFPCAGQLAGCLAAAGQDTKETLTR